MSNIIMSIFWLLASTEYFFILEKWSSKLYCPFLVWVLVMWCGVVWCWLRCGMTAMVICDVVWCGRLRCGVTGQGVVWCGKLEYAELCINRIRCGAVWCGDEIRCSVVWPRELWEAKVFDMVRWGGEGKVWGRVGWSGVAGWGVGWGWMADWCSVGWCCGDVMWHCSVFNLFLPLILVVLAWCRSGATGPRLLSASPTRQRDNARASTSTLRRSTSMMMLWLNTASPEVRKGVGGSLSCSNLRIIMTLLMFSELQF